MEKRTKCYNSGRISGLSLIAAAKKFGDADKVIFRLGYQPVNPLYNCLQWTAPWLLHMIVDIISLMRCPVVFFQRDWMESRGARIEFRIARMMGKEMIFQK